MKIAKTYKLIMASSFTLVISIPLFYLLFAANSQNKIDLVENRELTDFPTLAMTKNDIKRYPKKFEQFFDDHFFERKRLVSFFKNTQFYFFNSSTNKDIFIGKEGWLYRIAPLKTIEGRSCDYTLNKNQLKKVSRNLKKAKKFFDRNNIQFAIVVVPIKLTVYPEYLPNYIINHCDLSKKRQIHQIQEINDKNGPPVVYPLDILRNSGEYPFNPKNFHWTQRGAKIVNHYLSKNYLTIKNYPGNEKEIAYDEPSDMFGSLGVDKFDIKAYRYPIDGVKVTLEPIEKLDIAHLLEKQYEWTIIHQKSNIKDKSKLLIIGDSFGVAMAENLNSYFSETLRVDFNFMKNEDSIRAIIKNYKPDTVIYVMIESETHRLSQDLLFKSLN